MKEIYVFGNQARILTDLFKAKLTTCLLFNLRPCCPFILQTQWFLVCLYILRYLGQAVMADWLALAERSPHFSHHIYSSSSSGGSTAVPVLMISPSLFHELQLKLIVLCPWVFITATSPQLPCSNIPSIEVSLKCGSSSCAL